MDFGHRKYEVLWPGSKTSAFTYACAECDMLLPPDARLELSKHHKETCSIRAKLVLKEIEEKSVKV